jgi:mRNA deadenylase 3'-5' endonuclease subunit Ccr4
LVGAGALSLSSSKAIILPSKRPFLPVDSIPNSIDPALDGMMSEVVVKQENLRVLQFNMLADGLSGLRDDLGAFSRTTKDDLKWERRRVQLIHEMLQYDPDIITLQECDHFYDWFFPYLSEFGYDGTYAPKPASACLQVSDNSDGCAIFVRSSKLAISSIEVLIKLIARTMNDIKLFES